MIYKCKACNAEFHRGFLPSATCGLLLFVYGFPAALLVMEFWAPVEAVIGWWIYVLFIPAFLAIFTAIYFLFQFVEACWAWLRKCPHCGKRTWSRGYTSGFGL